MCREILMVDLCHPHLSQYVGKRLATELVRSGRVSNDNHKFFVVNTKRVKNHYSNSVHEAEVLDTVTVEMKTVEDVEKVWCAFIE